MALYTIGDLHLALSATKPMDVFGGAWVGDRRIKLAIPNLYKTNGYILCPYRALVYTGLMDYRSRPGKRRAALMLTESDPRQCRETVIHALAISDRELDEWRMGG